MLAWLLGGFAVVVIAAVGAAAGVAVLCPDKEKRADAYRVLKLMLATATGAGGVFAVGYRLAELGVL
ncbi:hypothetical protein M8C13_06925 [Crossiella sp. SN42]|uniref:hypothetical protein n=1 Tax=Crossiella sp. SN42 TaxID=2944808 RepID=UPI00207C2DB8|nr:hypothetical protein [Crossiella sp. SN42]MCO1575489.1 hypothetical protein [Crossiella sp. SN42]